MNYWIKCSRFFCLSILMVGSIISVSAQEEDDLLSLLGDTEPETELVYATFKTSRIINLQSIENTAAGVLDFKIAHRFGVLNGGFYDLFGLDQASMRIGVDYGLTRWLTIGVGRSSFEKTYDGFTKIKLLRQSTGKKKMPLSFSLFAGSAIKTVAFSEPERDNYFSSRMYYTYQGILARKFSEGFSLQLSPTVVHRNLVKTKAEKNDVYALGMGGRLKLSKRTSINAEYIYLAPNQVAPDIKNSFSIGFDIETGGHVFQLHFTNSTSMIEKGFVSETVGNWLDGDVHFGFNVSRVFTLKKK